MNFTIPGLTGQNFIVNIHLLKLMQDHPDLFNENISITTIHGGFDGLIWGTEIGENYPIWSDLEWILRLCKLFKVNVRLNVNNTKVQQHNLQDDFGHATMRLFNKLDMDNQVEVSNDLLEDSLRANYYYYDFVSSSNKIITEANELIDASKKYDLVSINSRVNAKKEMLPLLPDKEKFEITLNCFNTDPNEEFNRYNELRSKFALGSITMAEKKELGEFLKTDKGYENIGENGTTVSTNDLEMLKRMGYNNFRIEAGDTIFDTIESYLYYLVKDEFRDLVRQELLNTLV